MPAHCNNQFVKNQFSIMKLQLIWPDLPYGFQHKTFTLLQDHCYYALEKSTFLQSFHKVSSILWLIINLVKVKQFIWCFLSSHKYSNLAQVNNRKSKPFLGSHKSSKGEIPLAHIWPIELSTHWISANFDGSCAKFDELIWNYQYSKSS